MDWRLIAQIKLVTFQLHCLTSTCLNTQIFKSVTWTNSIVLLFFGSFLDRKNDPEQLIYISSSNWLESILIKLLFFISFTSYIVCTKHTCNLTSVYQINMRIAAFWRIFFSFRALFSHFENFKRSFKASAMINFDSHQHLFVIHKLFSSDWDISFDTFIEWAKMWNAINYRHRTVSFYIINCELTIDEKKLIVTKKWSTKSTISYFK